MLHKIFIPFGLVHKIPVPFGMEFMCWYVEIVPYIIAVLEREACV